MLNKLLRLFLLWIPTQVAAAQSSWRVEAWFGDAWNAPAPVTFHQQDLPDLTLDGRWSTRPWRPTWYYGGRISHWNGRSAWAVEYLHHKVYLENPVPPQVDFFRITNGINNLLAERIWQMPGGVELGLGLGPVFAVPVSKVRGQSHGGAYGVAHSRYEYAGGTLALTLSRSLKLLPCTSGVLALKGTASRLHVSIARGSADLDNYAIHLHYGVALETAC